jgi:hypothetical protein
MAGTSDFLPFATAGGANVESQSDYAADSTTATGFVSGVASSAKLNKVWRQASFQAAMIANFVATELNINVADNGNLAAATANFILALGAAGRFKLTANTTFYVDAAGGSNSNNGLTSGTAWQTINFALNAIATNYDLAGYAVTLQMANGTNYAPFHQTQEYTGGGSVTLLGNTGNSTLTAIAGTAGSPVARISAGTLNISGVTLGGGTHGLLCDGGTVNGDTLSFQANSVAHVTSSVFGSVNLSGVIAIFGAAPICLYKQQGSMYVGNLNITFSANVNFSTALLVGSEPGTIFAAGISYTGTSTGAYYLAAYGGYINTGGAAAPSGFSAGSTGTAPNTGYFS